MKCLEKDSHIKDGHSIIQYARFISEQEDRKRKLQDKLKGLSQRTENASTRFSQYKSKARSCCDELREKLKCFENVKRGIADWEEKLIGELENKKKLQLQSLDGFLSDEKQTLTVKLPKVTVCKQNDYREVIKALTPHSLHELSQQYQAREVEIHNYDPVTPLYDYVNVSATPIVQRSYSYTNIHKYHDTAQRHRNPSLKSHNRLALGTAISVPYYTSPLSLFQDDDPLELSLADKEGEDTGPTNITKRPLPLPLEACIVNTIVYGRFAEIPGEEVKLYDVCVDSTGSMIFSDTDMRCLRILTGTNEASAKFTKCFAGGLRPHSLTYDFSGKQIIVAFDGSIGLVKYNGSEKPGRFKRLPVGFNPISLAYNHPSTGKETSAVFATVWPKASSTSVRRLNIESSGQFEYELGVKNSPCGIDYKKVGNKGYLVISTLKDGCLIKISTSGNPLWDNTVDARQPGILQQPFGVAILPNDYIAVTETSAHRVSIFSDTGKLMKRFGGLGSEPGMFNSPLGIAVRLFKELVIVDSGNKRIQIFTLDSLEMSLTHHSITLPINI